MIVRAVTDIRFTTKLRTLKVPLAQHGVLVSGTLKGSDGGSGGCFYSNAARKHSTIVNGGLGSSGLVVLWSKMSLNELIIVQRMDLSFYRRGNVNSIRSMQRRKSPEPSVLLLSLFHKFLLLYPGGRSSVHQRCASKI